MLLLSLNWDTMCSFSFNALQNLLFFVSSYPAVMKVFVHNQFVINSVNQMFVSKYTPNWDGSPQI